MKANGLFGRGEFVLEADQSTNAKSRMIIDLNGCFSQHEIRDEPASLAQDGVDFMDGFYKKTCRAAQKHSINA